MKRFLLVVLLVFTLGLHPFQFVQAATASPPSAPGISINLPVKPLKQLKLTSCGEAVIAMAYQYAYPGASLDERAILTYAEMTGYYTERRFPFTSPAHMVQITRHYTKDFLTGNVTNADQGLAVLSSELEKGNPIMLDLLARLDDPFSGAHFVLVTGLSIPADNKYAVMVYYNDPITGKNKASPWFGDSGVWSAWHNNGDPGGSGWWLSLQASIPELP